MYWVLATTTPLQDSIPFAAFGVHAAFHVAYTILSAVVPDWCVCFCLNFSALTPPATPPPPQQS